MAVVVRARDLVGVVGDVGGEVGELAVRAPQHAVLVVALLGGAQPGGAVVLVHALEPARAPRSTAPDSCSERSEKKRSIRTRKRASALPHVLQHQRDSAPGRPPSGSASAAPSIRSGQLAHVRAAVLLRLLAARPGANGLAELAHLGAGVVHVELTLDLVAGQLQRARQRVPVGGVASGGHGDGPGGVGRHELDLNARSRASPAPKRSPAARIAVSASRYQRSAMNRFRKPGPAISTLSTEAPSRLPRTSPRRSAIARGGSPSVGASSIAAFVE